MATNAAYNGLRLAGSLAKRDGTEVRVFLIGDAVGCALAGQNTPEGYFNLERMIRLVAIKGGEIGCCGTCIDARGISEAQLSEHAHRSTLDELTDWTIWADKVITF